MLRTLLAAAAVVALTSAADAATVTSRSGHRAQVSAAFAPHAQCLVDKLERAGFRIHIMTGFASRGNDSAHPTGNAIDINQCGFGVLCRNSGRLPRGYVAMAEACGVFSGSRFGDMGHFEMPHKYGYVYVNGGRGTHERHHRGGAPAGAFFAGFGFSPPGPGWGQFH